MPQFLKDMLLDHLQGLLIEQLLAILTAVGFGKWLYNKVDEWLFINLIEKPEKVRRRKKRMGMI